MLNQPRQFHISMCSVVQCKSGGRQEHCLLHAIRHLCIISVIDCKLSKRLYILHVKCHFYIISAMIVSYASWMDKQGGLWSITSVSRRYERCSQIKEWRLLGAPSTILYMSALYYFYH